ncbi:MAG: VWA domain-containing protein, partial [Planctomycetota bacterium]
MDHRLPALPLLLLFAGAAAAQAGQSTFGDARARQLAELGRLPGVRDIVVRDLINYHRHRLPLPKAGDDVALDLRFDRDAALPGDEVWLQVGYTAAPQGDRTLAGPCAVALVVDVSGSMQEAGKLTAVKAGLRAFVDRLRADDDVALVTFSRDARVVSPVRRRGDGRWLLDAIERLEPEHSTNLHAGLMLGIAELTKSELPGAGRRVILLTDGIANTGVVAPDQILADAARAGSNIDISTIGVGQNLDTALLQRLADGARGLFHFVADPVDVQKVFVDEADALLAAMARRVALTVQVPRSLEVVRVYQDGVQWEDSTFEVRLPDLNAGATGVVLVQCRARETAARDARARASLRYEGGTSRTTRTAEATAALPLRAAAGPPDVE